MTKRTAIPVWMAAALLCVGTAAAETLVIDGKVQVEPSSVPRPVRGASMKSVQQRFGEPVTRHATVGKPPITRWDYPKFSVFFEYDHVIDAVVTDAASQPS